MKTEINKKIKFRLIIVEFAIYVIVITILSGAFFYIEQSWKINEKIADSLEQLEKISDNKKYKINSYMNGVKDEIEELSTMEETKKILKEKLVSSELAVKLNVDEQTETIAEDIKNFIRANPKKTLNDLQNDDVFQNIAVQEVGYNGYSILEEYTKRTVLFHKDRSLIGKILAETNTDLPEHQKLTELSKQNMDVSGFYDWRDEDGKIRRKYMRLIYLNQKTADGVELLLITTGYIDNYKVSEGVVDLNLKYFEENIKKNDFGNIFLINPEGYIIYESEIDEHLGTNVYWNVNNDLVLVKSSIDINNINGVVFSDAYLDSYGELYPRFLTVSPVYDQNKLLGYVGLAKKMNLIFEIIRNSDNLGRTGESYLVELDQKMLISPLRNSNLDMFIQDINTENVNNCFNNQENFTNPMVGYDGENVLGVHTKILKTDWCLLTEIKEENIFEVNSQQKIFLQIVIFGFFIILGITKMTRQTKGIGKIKIVILFEKFIGNLNLGYIFVFSLIIGFSFSFGFKIESWTEFWPNKTFYLFSLLVLMMVFFYGFKLKNEFDKKLVTRGIFLAFLARIVLTLSQQNFFENSFRATALWTAASLLGFIGMLLFFYGFIGVIKKHDN